jgi:hypothetical protein
MKKLKTTTVGDIVKKFNIPPHDAHGTPDSRVDGVSPRNYGLAIIDEMTDFVYEYYKNKGNANT